MSEERDGRRWTLFVCPGDCGQYTTTLAERCWSVDCAGYTKPFVPVSVMPVGDGGEGSEERVRITEYSFDHPDDPDRVMPITVHRVGKIEGACFNPDADVWAVRWMSRCLNQDGEWEWEPQPSSRYDEFLARTRFSRDEALALARARAALGVSQSVQPTEGGNE